jgi:phosphoserine phosphatase
MFIATLIANPQSQNLTEDVLNDTTQVLGGNSFTWLNTHIAADIPLLAEPKVTDAIWSKLQNQEIDMVIQPSKSRRKKVLLADMDSTMIQQECIDELADVAGVGKQVANITARAMNGELDFNDALRERVGLLKGLDVSIIQEVLKSRITLMPGGTELLATMKANGAYAALVSGGFTEFTQVIAQKLCFDENRANILLHEDGKLTGQTGTPILGQQAKVDASIEITKRLGIGHEDVIAVGDGANDLGMLQLAGSGVALHAKPAVQAQAKIKLNHADLTGLLYLQGYRAMDFVK